jgi:uncharacterized membrane protein YdjX (TVP38/TMEM64 family)
VAQPLEIGAANRSAREGHGARRRYARPMCFLAAVILIAILNRHYGWSDFVNSEGLSFLRAAVAENRLRASLLYIAVTVICGVLLALPGVTFALLAGLLFGPVWGTLLCLVAATLGAGAGFIAGRYFLRDAVRPLVERNLILKRLLFDDVEKSGMTLLLVTRMLPIFPYNLQNFAYGITGIDFRAYIFYTFIFMLPGTAFFTVGAAGFVAQESQMVYFLVSGLLALAAAVVGFCLYRRYVRFPETK